MKRRGGLILTAVVLTVALALIPLSGNPAARWIAAALAVADIAVLIVLWRSIAKPLDTVTIGLELLASQDFSNRVRPTGEPYADRIADLFNRMAEQLKNERTRLREQEGFLRQIVEVSPMGVAVMDFDGRISLLNPSLLKMAGIDREDAPDGVAFSKIDNELFRAASRVEEGKSEVVRLSDTRIYRCSNLRFIESGFKRPFVLVESLTEEVMKAEREAYEKLIRVISHEVNNSMGGVASILETFSDISSDEEMRELADSGRDRCLALSDFIRSYADVVKLPAPSLADRDLGDEIRHTAGFLKTILPAGVRLELKLPENTALPVRVDPVMMEQMIVNVVRNAAESIASCPERMDRGDGLVEISAEICDEDGKSGNRVKMTVCDNGAGISGEASQKLFTPFYSSKSGGRGIGLTLVNEVLTRHGFRFSLLTGADGLTRFTVWAPLR